MKKQAASANYKFTKPIHPLIQDLISRTLVVDPKKRLTMRQIASHPLFNRPIMSKSLIPSQRSVIIKPSILQWDSIERVNVEPKDEMEMELSKSFEVPLSRKIGSKTTTIRTASSLFLHKGTHSKVRPRIHSNSPSVFETFKYLDEVQEVS